MKLRFIPLLLILAALGLSACGGSSTASSGAASSAENSDVEMPAEADRSAPVDQGGITGGTASEAAAPAAEALPSQQLFERLVIKTADMSIEVENVRAAEAAIRTRVGTLGGYVVSSQSNGSDESMSMNMSFRVPVERFEDALGGLEGMAKQVFSSTVQGEDVTEEFVDLEARRTTLEATRDRLLQLLARAETIEDTLRVNQSLNEYQTQIDQIEGRVKYLSQSAAMSTINVALSPVPAPIALVEEGWQAETVAREALSGLLGFGQGLASIVIILLVWSPVWLVLGLVIWLVVRKVRGATPPQATKPTP